jgi:hypothetical protein
MKRIALLFVLMLATITLAAPLTSTQLAFTRMEGPVTSADSVIDLTTAGDWWSGPGEAGADANFVMLKQGNDGSIPENGFESIVCLVDASGGDGTCTVNYYVWPLNGPALRWCSVTCTISTQAVVKYSHDKSTATNAYWVGTITVTNYAGEAEARRNSGNSGVAIIDLGDLRGYACVKAVVTALGAGGTSANVYGRGW